jgi:tetratricopeptide (TPR) repeat protein
MKNAMDPRRAAYALCDAGKFSEALEHFKTLESKSADRFEKAGYLADLALCYHELGHVSESEICMAKAKELVLDDPLGSVPIDYLAAIFLIEEGKPEQGLQKLSRIVANNIRLFRSEEGRELYQRIQVERGFTLMHLSRNREARPLLEEALSFDLEKETKSNLHCHLGRCYCELSEFPQSRDQFLLAESIGVNEDWEATFHYYFGYALFELNDFAAASRQFILCLQSRAPGPPESLIYKMLAETSRKLGDRERARLYDQMAKSS